METDVVNRLQSNISRIVQTHLLIDHTLSIKHCPFIQLHNPTSHNSVIHVDSVMTIGFEILILGKNERHMADNSTFSLQLNDLFDWSLQSKVKYKGTDMDYTYPKQAWKKVPSCSKTI